MIIDKLNSGWHNETDAEYDVEMCGTRMMWTFLEVSWSRAGKKVSAYTHLGEDLVKFIRYYVTFKLFSWRSCLSKCSTKPADGW